MKNEFKCSKCGESKVIPIDNGVEIIRYEDCPTCKTGDMCLAIKCTRTPYSMIEPSGYYILTDAEVEELNIEGECKSPICEADSWLCSEGVVAKCIDRKWTRLPWVEKGVITFKGSKVVLIPIEKG